MDNNSDCKLICQLSMEQFSNTDLLNVHQRGPTKKKTDHWELLYPTSTIQNMFIRYFYSRAPLKHNIIRCEI